MSKELDKINKELKIYINEASFISMKCRNKLLKIFSEEFAVKLDISNYQNVDIEITEDYKVLYREDIYTSNDEINSMGEIEIRYQRFKEKADNLIKKKEIDFQNKSTWNNIGNLFIILLLVLAIVGICYLVIHSFLIGDYYNCLWFMLFIFPMIVPNLKESLRDRIVQAKNYLKRLFRK